MWSLNELWIQLTTQAASAFTLIILGYLLSVAFGLCGIAIALTVSIYLGALIPMAWRSWKLVTDGATNKGPLTAAVQSP